MSITCKFETGVNGNTIATGDAGSATAWDAITIGTTGVLVYDNTHVHDTLAAKISTGGSAAIVALAWSTALGTQSGTHFGRIYCYFTANPGTIRQIAKGTQAGGATNAWFIRIQTDGKINIQDGASTSAATSTNAIPLNQWVRLEYKIVQSTTVGQVEVKMFSADSTTATETITTAASLNTRTSTTQVLFGNASSQSGVTAFWLDNIVAAATAYPGPVPVNTVAPAVTGSTPVGSTLTCDGGTWGGTFTLTYQWTRDGSNIASATSSTYVTVSADATHAVGCTVTATGQQATNESASQASSNTITVTSGAITSGASMPYEAATQLVSTDTLPYETLNGIRATGQLPYTALKALQATGQSPYEALLSLAATDILAYEALKKLASTGPLVYETLAGLRVTGPLPYESLSALTVMATIPYEAQQSLKTTGALVYEALSGLASTGVVPYETLKMLAATDGLPYSTLLGLRATDALAYEALRGLAAAVTDPYEAVQGLAATGLLPYETLGQTLVTSTAVLPYETLAALTLTGALPYETLQGLAATNAAAYETLRRLAATAGIPSESLLGLAGVAALPYESLGIAAVSVSNITIFAYETLQELLGARANPYGSLSTITRTAPDPYESLSPTRRSGLLPNEANAGLNLVLGLPHSALAGVSASSGLVVEALRDLAFVYDLPTETSLALLRAAVLMYETLGPQVLNDFPFDRAHAQMLLQLLNDVGSFGRAHGVPAT